MPERRIAITGLGLVTPAGIGLEEFWNAMLRGAQPIRPITRFEAANFPSRIGGELEDFSPRRFVPKSYRKAVKLMARDIQIAVAAADLAVTDAGMVTRAADDGQEMTIHPQRLGCNIGAGLISPDLNELGEAFVTAMTDGAFDLKAWGGEGINNLTPLWLLKYLPNMLSCHVTIIHGCRGPSNTITCGEASGHLSVGEAARWIQRDAADAVLAGGAESKLCPMGLMRQTLLNRLCTSGNDSAAAACRPFDADHDGAVVGEGGGVIVLEEMQSAERRGARIYAELVGFGAACDPGGMDVETPTAGSLDAALTGAMKDAGISPQDVGLIVPHATAMPGEDLCEARAWGEALGQRAREAPAFALTGATGTLFAGSGAVELGAAAMALHTQNVPPTVNFAKAADGCELNLSAERRDGNFQYAVSGAFSVGGQSAACILKKYEQ